MTAKSSTNLDILLRGYDSAYKEHNLYIISLWLCTWKSNKLALRVSTENWLQGFINISLVVTVYSVFDTSFKLVFHDLYY